MKPSEFAEKVKDISEEQKLAILKKISANPDSAQSKAIIGIFLNEPSEEIQKAISQIIIPGAAGPDVKDKTESQVSKPVPKKIIEKNHDEQPANKIVDNIQDEQQDNIENSIKNAEKNDEQDNDEIKISKGQYIATFFSTFFFSYLILIIFLIIAAVLFPKNQEYQTACSLFVLIVNVIIYFPYGFKFKRAFFCFLFSLLFMGLCQAIFDASAGNRKPPSQELGMSLFFHNFIFYWYASRIYLMKNPK